MSEPQSEQVVLPQEQPDTASGQPCEIIWTDQHGSPVRQFDSTPGPSPRPSTHPLAG